LYKKLKILLPVVLLILFALIQFFDVIPVLDNLIHDSLLASAGTPSEEIIIVGLDDRSINEIGTWPWPRFFVADAIEMLADMNAAAIGVNILYIDYGVNYEYDMALVEAASKTDRLVLASQAYFMDTREFIAGDYLIPFEELDEVTQTGFINVHLDTDGVLRRTLTSVRFGDIMVHSLPLETYRTYCRVMGTLFDINDIPLDDMGTFPITYTGRPFSYRAVSLWGVINDEYNPELFRDKIVLIGPYAQGIGEHGFQTSLDRRTYTYSVEINANIIQNMLEGNFKQNAQWWQNLAVLAFFGLIIILLLHKLKPVPSVILIVGLIGITLLCVRFAYDRLDLIIKAGDIIVFLILCFLGNLALSILATQHEKNHIHGLFGRFVAPEVVSELVSGGVDLQLGGVEKEITVLFVDIRGFTAFSEKNPPEKVVSMVNRYLALTSHSIQEHSGTIDKYMGDATMAVFNAPNNVVDHALKAVRAAWSMKEGSVKLQEEILKDYGVELQFGIGINTGSAIVGNMGSDFRMEYTAIGDTVNTAARLEANAGKGEIIISDATYQLVKDYVNATDMGVLNVKNKEIGIQIYSVDGLV
jgi:adenylate cyclase